MLKGYKCMTNKEILSSIKKYEVNDATFFSEPYFVMEKALGSIIYDVESRPYIDMCAGFGSLPLGHNHPIYQDIYRSYLTDSKSDSKPLPCVQGMSDVFSSVDKYNLLLKLSEIFPNSKFSFALTGSQIITTALKTAILYTKGTAFIAFSGAYHGLDFGALSVTERQYFKRNFPSWYGNTYFCDYNSYEIESQIYQAIEYFRSSNQKVAGIILEPIQGRAGCKIPDEGWIQKLRQISSQQNILLIYDEIFTGLGRAGTLSYSLKVPADIICLGKALGGGLPISVCVAPTHIMDAWPSNQGEAIHTGTFFGHPLASRFALKTLDYLISNKICDQVVDTGKYFLDLLHNNLDEFDAVKSIRGQGLMCCVEFIKKDLGAIISDLLRKDGIIAIPEGEDAQCLSFTPALNIPRSLLDEVVLKLKNILKFLY